MKYNSIDILMQEVPDEISLAYEITGCPNMCKKCHSPELRDSTLGIELTSDLILKHSKK